MTDAGGATKTSSVKLVLLGESAVGKSSLVLRFVNNDFQENKEPTIGAAFLTQKCHLSDKTIKFEIWDTAGQERFSSLAPMYYRNAQAALVVYDITKRTSFRKAEHWVKELLNQASSGIVIALVGNKLDLAGGVTSEDDEEDDADRRAIPTEEARAYADKPGDGQEKLLFFETSAKSGENVQAVFEAIANEIKIPEGGSRGPAGAGGAGRAGHEGTPQSLNLAGAREGAQSGCAC